MDHAAHGGHAAHGAHDSFLVSLALTVPIVLYSPIGEALGIRPTSDVDALVRAAADDAGRVVGRLAVPVVGMAVAARC